MPASAYDVEQNDVYINLVETATWLPLEGGDGIPDHENFNKEYVTLSYCWGLPFNEDHTLQTENYAEFLQGFTVGRLPQTLRDAVHFAARLEGVGYIWIDALCIKQDSKEDWAQQSVQMDQVYSNTYLNLSATSSSDKKGGLYRHRDPALLNREEVLLNVRGLPNAIHGAKDYAPVVSEPDVDIFPKRAVLDEYLRQSNDTDFLRACSVLEVDYWSQPVNPSPVNTRGWVFQERRLSPRALHFCHDQVAWECQGINGCPSFTACEKQVNGLTNCYLTEKNLRIVSRQPWILDSEVIGAHREESEVEN